MNVVALLGRGLTLEPNFVLYRVGVNFNLSMKAVDKTPGKQVIIIQGAGLGFKCRINSNSF
ncbi:MAG: hypothetical protein BRD49_04215 [Bacteroidetes bacterium SW_10_40_5]|nr:MAG: hypothetical protein BRD49_04215 [Bacteroidetes bacterium SW_10_40_5]